MNVLQKYSILTYTVFAFLVLFIIAVYLYLGGNQFNPSAIGYSWVHNYWCDLMDSGDYYKLGKNQGQLVAIAAMTLICGGLCFLLLRIVIVYQVNGNIRKTILGSGCISMLAAVEKKKNYTQDIF